ncbi:MAG: DHH family phosphoesterase [Lachnospiraceae bacterium]
MFALNQLREYRQIVIQCHDNPDADAIGSAFALFRYFTGQGISCRIVYGGRIVSKSNLVVFIEELKIPLEHINNMTEEMGETLARKDVLLLTVDCQHGAGNVTRLPGINIAVIDHHNKETDLAHYERIEAYLGSCATVVWRMLTEAGYDIIGDLSASTALYYGLYTDTNSLAELFHPIDRDMLESLQFDHRLIRYLKGSNISREELLIIGQALSSARFDTDNKNAIFQTEPCDPNILGFVSDLTIQTAGIDTCVGFCEIDGGVKLSLRSGGGEVMANEMAAFLARGVGSGGGSREKAGGFLRLEPGIETAAWLQHRIDSYFASYDKLEIGKDKADILQMKRYRKKPVTVGYVILTDLYPEGTEVTIRTLEGDAVFIVTAATYLMVGIKGEVYPIATNKFQRSYQVLEEEFSFPAELVDDRFYAPTIRERLYGRTLDLHPHIRACRALEQSMIYARPLKRNTKVFYTSVYIDGYMFGRPGDYLAARCDDPKDIYVIEARIFDLTYELLDKQVEEDFSCHCS